MLYMKLQCNVKIMILRPRSHTRIHKNVLTWIVTMRGKGCRVLAPPSIATPRVLAFFSTRTKRAVATGKGEPVS